MATLTLVLWLFVAVLLSAVIDQLIPRVTLPLIQVVMGIIIALFAGSVVDVNLDPELFLVLFIAPLLYIEAKGADKSLLWKNKKPILSLAIGLVVVSTLVIGFVVNAMLPAIGLASAFALGAALGPTDAVAVSALSRQIKMPARQWGILKGELLLNDASGIVSFQFALAAAVTGTFSIIRASEAFLVEFIGGLAVGFAIGWLANFILRKIRNLGIESTTFHVLYEICIPLIVYLLAQALHVSGIIAVVVAGLLNVIAPRTTSPAIAHMNIVSTNVWDVISFTLNGIVFVLLGTQLPTSMYYTWLNPDVSNIMLIVYIVAITATLMGVRFIWCLAMEIVHVCVGEKRRMVRNDFISALLLTLCGSKGTITLSILFTIPFVMTTGEIFPERSLIIFLGCGVIVGTLLIANFIVPLVSPKRAPAQTELDARKNYLLVLSDILRNVIEQLTKNQTPDRRRATRSVIKIYQDRLNGTKSMIDSPLEDGEIDESVVSNELRLQALKWEQERTLVMLDENLVSKDVGFQYLHRLERTESFLKHRDERGVIRRAFGWVRLAFIRVRISLFALLGRAHLNTNHREELRKLQLDTAEFVIHILRNMIVDENVQTENASKLLLSYEQRASIMRGSRPSVTTTFKISDESDEILGMAYQIELEQIQHMYEIDRITRQEATRMRDNVHVMQLDLEDKL